MAEIPKNRQELLECAAKAAFGPADETTAPNWLFVDRAAKVIEAIESLGLRIIPEDPTEEMIEAMLKAQETAPFDLDAHAYRAAIAASPFAVARTAIRCAAEEGEHPKPVLSDGEAGHNDAAKSTS